VAKQVHEEGAAQGFTDSFVGQKATDVEKVAGVLPVKTGPHFSGIKVRERNDARFGESKRLLDGGRNRA